MSKGPPHTDQPPARSGHEGDARLPSPEIDGFEIIEQIGRGGMGVVYRAVQLSTRREVALKVLDATFEGARAHARFQREITIMARLSHPHIARIYESGTSHGHAFLVMEKITGIPLDQFVAARNLSPTEILRLMRSACDAIQHAHQNGIIHRDLKPSNILVSNDGCPHILDFGLAKAMEADETRAQVSIYGMTTGTPAFMSPEQAAGRADLVDTTSDVFALGVLLFVLLTRQHPYNIEATPLQIAMRIASDPPRRPSEILKGFNRELEAVLLKALAKRPEDRYLSGGELARDLGNFLSGDPVLAKPITTSYLLRKWLAKHRREGLLIAVVLILAILGTIYAYVRIADQKRLALRGFAEANEQKQLAEQCASESQLQLANAKIAEADILRLSRKWDDATKLDNEAHSLLQTLGMPTWGPDVGLWFVKHDSEDLPTLQSAANTHIPWTRTFQAHGGAITSVALAPDGRTFATASTDGTVKIWDWTTIQLLKSIEQMGQRANVVIYSRDGGKVMSGWSDRTIREIGTDSELHSLIHLVTVPVELAADQHGNGIVWISSQARHAYSLLKDARTRFVTLPDNILVRQTRMSPDSTSVMMVMSGFTCLQPLEIRQLEDDRLIRCIQVPPYIGPVDNAALSDDGSMLFTYHRDESLRAWTLALNQSACFSGHANRVTQMAANADGQLLLTVGDDGGTIWDATRLCRLCSLPADYRNITSIWMRSELTRIQILIAHENGYVTTMDLLLPRGP